MLSVPSNSTSPSAANAGKSIALLCKALGELGSGET